MYYNKPKPEVKPRLERPVMASPKAAGYAQLREVSYAQFKGRPLCPVQSMKLPLKNKLPVTPGM